MTNKELIQHAFAEMAAANSRPFVALLADDVTWRVMGQTPFSRSYVGKAEVLSLLGQLRERLADRYRATAQLVIAEGPYVVAQVQGQAMTKAGVPYNNEYCFVYRFEDGAIKEVTEYLDTELVTAALSSS